MTRETFGADSTNPRHRRAYAHASLHKALSTGKPEDKIKAVEAAVAANGTQKGKDLGQNVLGALGRVYRKALGESISFIYGPNDALSGGYIGWIGEKCGKATRTSSQGFRSRRLKRDSSL